MSDDPVFEVGDEVEYELGSNNWPRWDGSYDTNGTGVVYKAKVIRISGNEILTSVPTTGSYWCWPVKGAKDYATDQWQRPGFLRRVGAVQAQAQPKTQSKLTTNQLRTMLIGRENVEGCECGGWTCGGHHSSWCRCAKE